MAICDLGLLFLVVKMEDSSSYFLTCKEAMEKHLSAFSPGCTTQGPERYVINIHHDPFRFTPSFLNILPKSKHSILWFNFP